jgi:hypothetical protein
MTGNLTTILCSCHENLGTLTSWNPLGHSRPVTVLTALPLPLPLLLPLPFVISKNNSIKKVNNLHKMEVHLP